MASATLSIEIAFQVLRLPAEAPGRFYLVLSPALAADAAFMAAAKENCPEVDIMIAKPFPTNARSETMEDRELAAIDLDKPFIPEAALERAMRRAIGACRRGFDGLPVIDGEEIAWRLEQAIGEQPDLKALKGGDVTWDDCKGGIVFSIERACGPQPRKRAQLLNIVIHCYLTDRRSVASIAIDQWFSEGSAAVEEDEDFIPVEADVAANVRAAALPGLWCPPSVYMDRPTGMELSIDHGGDRFMEEPSDGWGSLGRYERGGAAFALFAKNGRVKVSCNGKEFEAPDYMAVREGCCAICAAQIEARRRAPVRSEFLSALQHFSPAALGCSGNFRLSGSLREGWVQADDLLTGIHHRASFEMLSDEFGGRRQFGDRVVAALKEAWQRLG